MIKETLIFAAAFALCAALGAGGVGCSVESGCPDAPPMPVARQGLRVTAATISSDGGISPNPIGGTVDISGNTVVLRYATDAVQHEVVYKVLPHPPDL